MDGKQDVFAYDLFIHRTRVSRRCCAVCRWKTKWRRTRWESGRGNKVFGGGGGGDWSTAAGQSQPNRCLVRPRLLVTTGITDYDDEHPFDLYIGRHGHYDDGAGHRRGRAVQRPVGQLVDRPTPGTDVANHKASIFIRWQKPRPGADAAFGPSAADSSENVISTTSAAAATAVAVGANRENVVATNAAVSESAGNVVA